MTEIFNSKVEAEKARELTKLRRIPRFYKSGLDKYSNDIIELHIEGCTVAEIHRWLLSKKKINVAWSTVYRWLKKNA